MNLHALLENAEMHLQQVRMLVSEGNLNTAYFHASEVEAVAFQLKNSIFREQRNSGEVK